MENEKEEVPFHDLVARRRKELNCSFEERKAGEKKLSQLDVCRALGISENKYWRFETGEAALELHIALHLIKLLNLQDELDIDISMGMKICRVVTGKGVENETMKEFENKLRELFHRLRGYYYDASKIRNAQKVIEDLASTKEAIENQEITVSSKEQQQKILEGLEKKEQKAQDAKKQLQNYTQGIDGGKKDAVQKKIFETIVKEPVQESVSKFVTPTEKVEKKIVEPEINITYFADDPAFSKYPREQKKLINKVVEVIENALTDKKQIDQIKQLLKEKLK